MSFGPWTAGGGVDRHWTICLCFLDSEPSVSILVWCLIKEEIRSTLIFLCIDLICCMMLCLRDVDLVQSPLVRLSFGQRCSRAWTEVDSLLCMKWSVMYVLCMFMTLRESGVHPLFMASTHFFVITTPLLWMAIYEFVVIRIMISSLTYCIPMGLLM